MLMVTVMGAGVVVAGLAPSIIVALDPLKPMLCAYAVPEDAASSTAAARAVSR